MVWDTARTKQLLLDAAVAEFAEHGLEGARVARVATRAGVNKERIYQYFGNKEKLFGAVLESELRKIAAAVPLTADQGADLGDYAGRLFDYHRRHPHFVRLLAWEGLQSRGPVVAEAERTEHYVEKVAALARAQEAGVLAQDIPRASWCMQSSRWSHPGSPCPNSPACWSPPRKRGGRPARGPCQPGAAPRRLSPTPPAAA